MKDQRIEKLITLILDYSVTLKSGETVLLYGIGENSLPYLKEAYKQCLLGGAKNVEIDLIWNEADIDLSLFASEEHINYFPQHRLDFAKSCDIMLKIVATDNSMQMTNVDPAKMASRAKVLNPIREELLKRKWIRTDIPTHCLAQNAKMSLEKFEDFYFSACFADYTKMSAGQEVLKKVLEKSKIVKIIAPDTDLTFNISGMPAIKCDGRYNLPDGEVFTAPIKNSINGSITFNVPTIFYGKEFNNIHLEFRDGKIIEASAGEMTKDLNKILDTDEGSRYTGEFSFGLNKSITKPMRAILFDEKIFGSFHLTPGSCYDECNNGNESAIHWDLIRIMREDYGGGKIFLDDILVQEDGKFTLPELQDLN